MIDAIINRIRLALTGTFASVDNWFDLPDELLDYSHPSGGWTIRQVLGHISLTNHYLLILILKGTRKAIDLSVKTDYTPLLNDYHFDWDALSSIGRPGTFSWPRPDHMEPAGDMSLSEVRVRLQKQLDDCLNCLRQLDKGQGILYKTTMTVNGLGKLDVYHYIYFLCQHARRHLIQMQAVAAAFQRQKL